MNQKFNYKNSIPKHLTKNIKKTTLHQKIKPKSKGKLWTVRGMFGISILLLVILVLPTVIVIPFTKPAEPLQAIAEKKNNETINQDDSITVSVMRTETNEIDHVPLETYVTRVVASEMPTDFELEALKAQGLAARTYIVNHLINQKDSSVSDLENDQVYKDEAELRKLWGEQFYSNIEKLTEAVLATTGQIITHNGKPITAAYFSTSNGYTENSEDYWEHELPYLRGVPSPWDEDSPKFLEQVIFSLSEISELLDVSIDETTNINLSRTSSERVDQVEISNKEFTGREIREILSLPSSDFSIKKNNQHIIFTTKGFGHGIGMSQYGANGMAKEGSTYEEIIDYYYTDVDIQSIDTFEIPLVHKE